jgi:hypothetical protein
MPVGPPSIFGPTVSDGFPTPDGSLLQTGDQDLERVVQLSSASATITVTEFASESHPPDTWLS